MNIRDMEVVESRLVAKTGNNRDCEDFVYVSDDFVAVVDGVTAKGSLRWGGMTGGKAACSQICGALDDFRADITGIDAVQTMTARIQEAYESAGRVQDLQAKPHERIMASIVVYSRARSEIWSYGDCQFMINGKLFQTKKPVDEILSQVRSLFLELEMLSGETIETLAAKDSGREFILPLLRRQSLLQNHPTNPYSYPVIDGFDIRSDLIKIESVPESSTSVVLASDGYPELMATLEQSETRLKELLDEDPLCFRNYRSTKGVRAGNVSFDDRAYVRLRIA